MTATDYVLALTPTELTRYRRMAEAARRDEGDLWTEAGIVPGPMVAAREAAAERGFDHVIFRRGGPTSTSATCNYTVIGATTLLSA